MNFRALQAKPYSLRALEAKPILEQMLLRGFTTVRDAGGADRGLAMAVENGLINGPRIYYSGRVISQTGGHGDVAARSQETPICACGAMTSFFSHVVDGPDAVRAAVRKELKNGATQIKFMASGGVASASDPLLSLQFSAEELAAGCGAASDWGSYSMAHAYSPDAIIRSVTAGVRSIEHGNLLDVTSAELMAQRDAFLVPTLVTYQAMQDQAEALNLPSYLVTKNADVITAGLRSLEIAKTAGVSIGFGTDLLGELHQYQSREFAIRSQVLSPLEIIRSATTTNAELLRAEGSLGCLDVGATADLLLVQGNPLEDIRLLAEPGENLRFIVKAGKIILNRLPE
jgi:imidazolonepropionase-like amidohydrolase